MTNTMERLKEELQDLDTKREKVLANIRTVKGLELMTDQEIVKGVQALECSNEYWINGDGEIHSWVKFDLSKYQDARDVFEEYMQETHCVKVEWENETLTMWMGEPLVIQDDTRRDNGVWDGHKLVIPESEYKEEGEVNEAKRNALIEAYMERTGCFPGIFRVDHYGNVFPVNTQEVS